MGGEKDLITAHQLAAELNLAVDTIWRYTREKKIPFVELSGKQYRYRLADVLEALAGKEVKETLAEYKADSEKKLTYKDYCALEEEPDYRVEVLDGVLIKDPSPNVSHQRTVFLLAKLLDKYFSEKGFDGELFISPLDVTLDEYSVVQPDLLYIENSQNEIIKHERIDGIPHLIIEIISPSSAGRDRIVKMAKYQNSGVQHYWIVDPQDKTLECYSLHDGIYARVAGGIDSCIVEHPEFTNLKIDLGHLWCTA